MQRVRYIGLAGLAGITLGSLAGTLGYAWYLRSDRYRDSCARHLTSAVGLPSDIGRVVPRSRSAREFDDVVVWLPERRSQALFCRRALVVHTPRPGDPHAYEIDLLGGTSEISTRTWLREDYRRVIEAGLRPGFDPSGPRRVNFRDMDLSFERGRFRGALEDATGTIVFDDPQSAWAAIHCRALNGFEAPEPVRLHARMSPTATGLQVDDLELTVPNLPVRVLNLESLVGVDVRSGTFSGRLKYREAPDHRELSVSGMCAALSLAECTSGLAPRPWRGSCPEVELQERTLIDREPQRLRFRGVLSGMVLGDMLAWWGLGEAGGEMTLRVRAADLSPAGIEHLVASGECTGVSLARLTEGASSGRISGTARFLIDDLTIEENRVLALEAVMRVDPAGEERWIEGRLITNLIGRLLNVTLPAILPERIEYTQLGFRVEVRDEVLYLFGTHGPRERTILTVRLMDHEMAALSEPENPLDLGPWLDRLRDQVGSYLRRELEALPARHGLEAPLAPTSRPP